MRVLSSPIIFFFAVSSLASAGSIEIQTAAAYIHAGGAFVGQLTPSSGTFFSTLDTNNIGTFGWSFTNTTALTLVNVTLFGFLDGDLDNDMNTFFNEYGEILDLSLPPLAPGGSIPASSWQIDEPGFVFGTILNDLQAGTLQDANFVPSSAPDDVSLALGFFAGTLAPGQNATLTLQISRSNIGGLQQIDPDSHSTFSFNGFVTVDRQLTAVPEPGTTFIPGVGIFFLMLRQRTRD